MGLLKHCNNLQCFDQRLQAFNAAVQTNAKQACSSPGYSASSRMRPLTNGFPVLSSSTDSLGVQDVARPDGAGQDAPHQQAAAPGQQPNGNRPASPLSVEMQHRLTHRPGGVNQSQHIPTSSQVRCVTMQLKNITVLLACAIQEHVRIYTLLWPLQPARLAPAMWAGLSML